MTFFCHRRLLWLYLDLRQPILELVATESFLLVIFHWILVIFQLTILFEPFPPTPICGQWLYTSRHPVIHPIHPSYRTTMLHSYRWCSLYNSLEPKCLMASINDADQIDGRRQRYMAESEASRASELGGPGASTLSELIDQVAIIKFRIHL